MLVGLLCGTLAVVTGAQAASLIPPNDPSCQSGLGGSGSFRSASLIGCIPPGSTVSLPREAAPTGKDYAAALLVQFRNVRGPSDHPRYELHRELSVVNDPGSIIQIAAAFPDAAGLSILEGAIRIDATGAVTGDSGCVDLAIHERPLIVDTVTHTTTPFGDGKSTILPVSRNQTVCLAQPPLKLAVKLKESVLIPPEPLCQSAPSFSQFSVDETNSQLRPNSTYHLYITGSAGGVNLQSLSPAPGPGIPVGQIDTDARGKPGPSLFSLHAMPAHDSWTLTALGTRYDIVEAPLHVSASLCVKNGALNANKNFGAKWDGVGFKPRTTVYLEVSYDNFADPTFTSRYPARTDSLGSFSSELSSNTMTCDTGNLLNVPPTVYQRVRGQTIDNANFLYTFADPVHCPPPDNVPPPGG